MVRALQAGGLAALGGGFLAACGGEDSGGELPTGSHRRGDDRGGHDGGRNGRGTAATTAATGEPVRGGTLQVMQRSQRAARVRPPEVLGRVHLARRAVAIGRASS